MSSAPEAAHTRLSDLFASAVHRYGTVWADLLVASLAFVALASLPVGVLHAAGAGSTTIGLASDLAYGIAYFGFLGFVMLRGLPARTGGRRVVATYAVAVVVGGLAGLLLIVLSTMIVALLPLLLLCVPAAAAGDASAVTAIPLGILLVLRNFTRTYAVWLVTMVFSAPVGVSMFLVVNAFAGGGAAVLLALLLSVPVVWPFSALFVRALYGDLTGRNVVAPQDRTTI